MPPLVKSNMQGRCCGGSLWPDSCPYSVCDTGNTILVYLIPRAGSGVEGWLLHPTVIFKSMIVGAGCRYMWDSGVYNQQPPACPLYSGHQRSRQKWLHCSGKKLPLTHFLSSSLTGSFVSIQDTSVLSPIISPVVITATLSYHILYSHSGLVHTHYLLFFSAFGLQITKTALLMMVSTGSVYGQGHSRQRGREELEGLFYVPSAGRYGQDPIPSLGSHHGWTCPALPQHPLHCAT